MGNVLEFYLRMKDMMSSGFAAAARNGRAAMNNIRDAVGRVQNSMANARRANDTLSNSFNALNRRARQLQDTINNSTSLTQIREARRELERLQRQIYQHPATRSGGGSGSGGMMGGLFRRFAPAAMLAGALAFGGSAVQASARFESTNKSFEVLTQSKKKGGELANNLNDLQQNTILGPEVFNAAQTMLAFGVATDKVLPSIKMIGDVAMGDAERLKSLTLAFSQVTSAGKLQGQDLLQFVNAGFNPLQIIAKQTGKSMSKLRDEMKDGAITSDMVAKAFESATSKGGQFYGMMDRMAETTAGKQAQLSGSFEAMKIAIGDRLTPIVGAYTEELTGLTGKIKDWFAIPMSEKLMEERTGVSTLVSAITNLNEGNSIRTKLINELIAKYPELFGNIDAEKIKNSELLKTLEDINGAYQKRIDLALNSERVANETKEMNEAWSNYVSNTLVFERYKDTQSPEDLEKQKKNNWGIGSSYYHAQKSLKDYQAHKSNVESLKISQRIMELDSFTSNKAEYDAAFKNRPKDKQQFDEIVNTYRKKGIFSGYGIETLDLLDKLKAGKVTPSKANAGGAGLDDDEKKTKAQSKDVANGIAGGGPRVINIHGVKFMDKMENHFNSAQEGIDNIEKRLEEMFMRILQSGAKVQS